ncbi:hypothetical protein ACTJLC_12740 [Paraburkholderia sp. 22099]|jgi:hypothetical protein|nr:hypothetical protein [Paraburkholderia terricola]MDR6492056.1 hypothetical protein [Paraburkholderia terricola]
MGIQMKRRAVTGSEAVKQGKQQLDGLDCTRRLKRRRVGSQSGAT